MNPAAARHPIQNIFAWILGSIGLFVFLLIMIGQTEQAADIVAGGINNTVDFVEWLAPKIHLPGGDSANVDLPSVSMTDEASASQMFVAPGLTAPGARM